MLNFLTCVWSECKSSPVKSDHKLRILRGSCDALAFGFAAAVKSERKYASDENVTSCFCYFAKPLHTGADRVLRSWKFCSQNVPCGHYQIDGPCLSWEMKQICETRVDEKRTRGRTRYTTFKYDTLTFPRCCVYKGSSLGDELHEEGLSSSERQGTDCTS